MMHDLFIPPAHRAILAPVVDLLRQRAINAWLVGGYVRDLALGQPGVDIDIAVDGSGFALARIIADRTGGAFVALHDATDAARIVWPAAADQAVPLVVDLVRLRAPTIDADLRLRDITINALALPLERWQADGSFDPDALLDPCGGLHDLHVAHTIRLCGPTAFTDDPLRMLRAVRFAAQFDFTIARETDAALRAHAARIVAAAPERVREDVLKLLAARHAAPWLAYLDDVRLLTQIIPELDAARDCPQPKEHFLPVLGHLFEAVCAWEWLYAQLRGQGTGNGRQEIGDRGRGEAVNFVVPVAVQRYPDLSVALPQADLIVARMEQQALAGHRRYALFKLAVLLHDVAKPATKAIKPNGRVTFYDHQELGGEIAGAIGQRLRLNREATAYLRLIVREHMRPGQLRALGPELTRRALFRLLRDTGEAAPDVLIHSLCDHMAARGPNLSPAHWADHVAWTGAVLQENWRAQQIERPARLLNGADLLRELGLAPGPMIGQLLAAVEEAQFMGDVTTRAEALALAARLARNQPREQQP